MKKLLGDHRKTTLIGYGLAVMTAVQPLLDAEVDFSNKLQVAKYALRLCFAAGIAIFSRMAADGSPKDLRQ